MSIFAAQLKKALKMRNISRRELAERCGMAENSISRYTLGSNLPNTTYLRKICDALNVSADFLIDRRGANTESGLVWKEDAIKAIGEGLDYAMAKNEWSGEIKDLNRDWNKALEEAIERVRSLPANDKS